MKPIVRIPQISAILPNYALLSYVNF